MWTSPMPAKIRQLSGKTCCGSPRPRPTAVMTPSPMRTSPGHTPSVSASIPSTITGGIIPLLTQLESGHAVHAPDVERGGRPLVHAGRLEHRLEAVVLRQRDRRAVDLRHVEKDRLSRHAVAQHKEQLAG